MMHQRVKRWQRLAWLEGIRVIAVVMLLLYYAQLRFTGYAYTPQPTGVWANLRLLVVALDGLPRSGLLPHMLNLPSWFGFQFVDVLVLVSGFSLVLSTHETPWSVGQFLRQRSLRILFPFWTVAWVSYPVLWGIAIATRTSFPNPWQLFVAASYPLMYDQGGSWLMSTTGPWWAMSLVLSFSLLFPFLWFLQRRWGSANLLTVALLITLFYRFLSVYWFGGHPTYVLTDSMAGWQPFALFLAKLSTFVLGMAMGQTYLQGKGPVFWPLQRALLVGASLYAVGVFCQFYQWGWVFADLVIPAGLTLGWMVVFRILESWQWVANGLIQLGTYTYTFFLLHGLVVDRTLDLIVRADVRRYVLALPLMVAATFVLAMLMDAITPSLQRFVVGAIRDVDHVLSVNVPFSVPMGPLHVGDKVNYQGEEGWIVLKIEKLWDEQEVWLYQVSDGRRSLWVQEQDLQPTGKRT
jgi:peptidoglycan/LPS O-acetylase OafA/YrhL